MSASATPELKAEIKSLVLETLNVTGVSPEEIDDSVSLFEQPALGLDSIDVLEIVVALQKRYGVHIDDQNLARTVIRSVETIAEFVATERAKTSA